MRSLPSRGESNSLTKRITKEVFLIGDAQAGAGDQDSFANTEGINTHLDELLAIQSIFRSTKPLGNLHPNLSKRPPPDNPTRILIHRLIEAPNRGESVCGINRMDTPDKDVQGLGD